MSNGSVTATVDYLFAFDRYFSVDGLLWAYWRGITAAIEVDDRPFVMSVLDCLPISRFALWNSTQASCFSFVSATSGALHMNPILTLDFIEASQCQST